MLIDTHCHIHESDFTLDISEVLERAQQAGVDQMVCVGTGIESSARAVAFARQYDQAFASIGVHPHDAKDGWESLSDIKKSDKIVAIGEIGLDYFYTNSPRETQIKALEWQLQFAQSRNLPVIFHVREAFDDFWPLFDSFKAIRGELHSFTDTTFNRDKALQRGLLIGVNGISTFTKDELQKEMFASIPLSSLLVETDAPFLTPVPFRGKVNEPAFVKNIAEFHALLRHITLEEVAAATTTNARALFAL
jgi:TatD DNase family protein